MENKPTTNKVYYVALGLAIWFALTSACWVYLANVILSFPFGVLSLLLYLHGKKVDANAARYKNVFIILVIGVVLSVVAFFALWLSN